MFLTLTLEEFLASVFLEEGFVAHWTMKIVDHQAEDRVNFVLSVSGIVGEGSILRPVSIFTRLSEEKSIPKVLDPG